MPKTVFLPSNTTAYHCHATTTLAKSERPLISRVHRMPATHRTCGVIIMGIPTMRT